jgi:GNAT superfamily N-acetyltransferase
VSDMLVKLYDLPELEPRIAEQRAAGVSIRRAIAPEKHVVLQWVRAEFGPGWASECDVAFANHPVSCFIAIARDRLAGFACYDATYRDFFGPIGVAEDMRDRGVGTALLLAGLHAMAAEGYAYAIIGDVARPDYYARTVDAVSIEGSTPGIYRGILRSKSGREGDR